MRINRKKDSEVIDKIYAKEIDKNIELLYEDNHIIVCIKPEGVLSQKDITNDIDMLTIIKKYLKDKYNKPGDAYLGLIHRLDRRCEGIMVFGKTSKASSRLSEEMRSHNFHKVYLAICEGVIEGNGKLVNLLSKDNKKAIENKNGKEASLDYEVVNSFKLDDNDFTVVRINLNTGKFNQIRKQMELFKHPLINDFKYGYRLKNYDNSLGLRCVTLGFIHPITKEYMEFVKYKSETYANNVSFKKYMEE